MDKDERACLTLPPGFITFPTITAETAKYEGNLANTKIRYWRMGAGTPEDQEQDLLEDPEKSEEQEIREEEHREVYSRVDNTLNFQRLRASDLRDIPRNFLPAPRPE